MSDAHLLGISGSTDSVPDCDSGESRACRQVAATIVTQASSVLAGRKPAAVFSLALGSCRCRGRSETVRCMAQALAREGIRLQPLARVGERTPVLVWREDLLLATLADPEARAFLESAGYDVASPAALASAFRHELVRYHAGSRPGGYPHEVGVLLGYPLADVRGFLRGGKAVCVGAWRCYAGDADAAQRRFDAIRAFERSRRCLFDAGTTLGELIA